MGINWDKEAVGRLISAMLAAHPELSPDYKAISVFFGQGATYDAIQYRFREYRQTANMMRNETPGQGKTSSINRRAAPTTPSTPKMVNTTPRTNSKGGVSKPGSFRKPAAAPSNFTTPTKSTKMRPGDSKHDCIMLDDDDDDDLFVKQETAARPANELTMVERLGVKDGFAIFGLKEEAPGKVPEASQEIDLQPRAESVPDEDMPQSSAVNLTNMHSIFGNLDDLDEVV